MKYIYERRMNYYETDKMGIVHHSNYIRFLEEARCYWMKEANITMACLEEKEITIPTLEVKCKYINHVTDGDVIIIKPRITQFNGVRMNIEYEVIEEKTGKTVIEASTKHCFTNRQLRPINLKKNNVEFYEKFNKLANEEK